MYIKLYCVCVCAYVCVCVCVCVCAWDFLMLLVNYYFVCR